MAKPVSKLRKKIILETDHGIFIEGDLYLAKTQVHNWPDSGEFNWEQMQTNSKDGRVELHIPTWLATQRGILDAA